MPIILKAHDRSFLYPRPLKFVISVSEFYDNDRLVPFRRNIKLPDFEYF